MLTMPFRGRRMSAPITSVKHVVDAEGQLLATGAPSTVDILTATTVRSTVFQPAEVTFGSKVNAFFLSIFIIGATGAPIVGSVNWFIIKTHDGQTTIPTPGNTGISSLRNQIFHEEKGLAGSGDGTPMAFKGVVMLPRGMRRIREGDKVSVSLALNAASTGDATFCVKAIYKSFDWLKYLQRKV